MQETWVQSLGQEDPLKKEIATDWSIFPGKSMDRGPGGLVSMESQRVGHDLVTNNNTNVWNKESETLNSVGS